MSSQSSRQAEVFMGVGSWMICSVGMMLANKLAITSLPLECVLTSLQMVFTILALLLFARRSLYFGSLRDVMRWSMVAPFYAGMLLTSILALKTAPMTLVIVLRSLSPLFSLAIERFYPNPLEVSKMMVLSIVIILAGTVMYASQLNTQSWVGVQWCFLNMFFAVGDRLLQRLMLSRDQSPVDISKTGCTILNNVFALVPILILATWKREFAEVPRAFSHLDHMGCVYVSMSCIFGLGISYTGIWAQSLISATSFLVLVSANKFVLVFIEVFALKTKALTHLQIIASLITIAGGIAYGIAREDIEKKKSKSEKDSLVPQETKASP